MRNDDDFNMLIGKTLVSIEMFINDILITDSDGMQYMLYRPFDSIFDAVIEDICCNDCNYNSIINSVVLSVEIINFANPIDDNHSYPQEYVDNFNWTFYKIYTDIGHMVIRWYGPKVNYNSEGVTFCQII